MVRWTQYHLHANPEEGHDQDQLIMMQVFVHHTAPSYIELMKVSLPMWYANSREHCSCALDWINWHFQSKELLQILQIGVTISEFHRPIIGRVWASPTLVCSIAFFFSWYIANSPLWLGGSILVFYIFDYTSQILYDKSRRFGTYSSAFFSAMTKHRQKLVYKREEGVELNTGSNLIKRERA